MRIRYFPAKYKHIEELDALNRDSLPENYSAGFWAKIIAQHLSHVAIYNNKIVGYILVGVVDDELDVVSFAVNHEFRNNGIGGHLLKLALSTCKKLNKKI